ncbi:MAG: hypothetical protein WDM92_15750 [Caulobacteraceae bacterium]
MLKGLKSAVAIACLSLGLAGAANAAAPDLSGFDARAADGWAQKLVLCDTIASCAASRPERDLIFVRRDDSRRFDMLLPPDFVGGGQWYKDGYQHLYLRLRHDKKISSGELTAARTRSAPTGPRLSRQQRPPRPAFPGLPGPLLPGRWRARTARSLLAGRAARLACGAAPQFGRRLETAMANA